MIKITCTNAIKAELDLLENHLEKLNNTARYIKANIKLAVALFSMIYGIAFIAILVEGVMNPERLIYNIAILGCILVGAILLCILHNHSIDHLLHWKTNKIIKKHINNIGQLLLNSFLLCVNTLFTTQTNNILNTNAQLKALTQESLNIYNDIKSLKNIAYEIEETPKSILTINNRIEQLNSKIQHILPL